MRDLPGVSGVTDDLSYAVTEIRDNLLQYQLALDHYNGDVPELFVSPAVKRALRGGLRGFDINLARRPVDAVLERLRVSAVRVPDDEAATRDLVDNVCTPNRFGRLFKRVARHACAEGDAYVLVWPGAEEGSVVLHFRSARTTRVFYDEDDERVPRYAAFLWCEGRGNQRVTRCDLYYPDRVERYVAVGGPPHGSESAAAQLGGARPGQMWDRYTDPEDDGEQSWPLPNPYGRVPIFHFRTDEPYGRPLHRGAFGPQNSITKLSAVLMSTVDFQGFPQRYKLLHPPSATDPARAAFEFDEDDEDIPGDTAPGLQAGPGTIWDLDAKAVGQFDPAEVRAFLEPLAFYARAMAAATATPLRFFDPSGDVPSGESLRADDAPLTHRIADLAELFEEELADMLGFAALVRGAPVPAVDVQWTPVQTVDDEAGWRTVRLKQQAGVPREQTLTEAGYLPDLVAGWRATPAAADVPSGE